jgi:hypothetical protein
MKVQHLWPVLVALIGVSADAHGTGQSDWWGPIRARITVHVLSSGSGKPVGGAAVSLISLDDPRPREYAHGVPAPQISDSSGYAVIRAEFDAAGNTRGNARLDLRGRLNVSCDGYRDASGLLREFPAALVNGSPDGDQSIELEIRLVPIEVGGSIAPTTLVPITFSTRGGGYVFKDALYAPDLFINACPSLVDAIASSVQMDDQLRLYVSDYRSKVGRSRSLFWGGVGVLLASGVAEVYFTTREPRSDVDRAAGIVCAGVAIVGGVASFFGMLSPGPPTQVVDYYNRTYTADGTQGK